MPVKTTAIACGPTCSAIEKNSSSADGRWAVTGSLVENDPMPGTDLEMDVTRSDVHDAGLQRDAVHRGPNGHGATRSIQVTRPSMKSTCMCCTISTGAWMPPMPAMTSASAAGPPVDAAMATTRVGRPRGGGAATGRRAAGGQPMAATMAKHGHPAKDSDPSLDVDLERRRPRGRLRHDFHGARGERRARRRSIRMPRPTTPGSVSVWRP